MESRVSIFKNTWMNSVIALTEDSGNVNSRFDY
jgi:hypothetical protein